MIRVYVLVCVCFSRDWKIADLMVQDVTEIIGTGKVDLGFKAMIHTLAVRFLCVVDVSEAGSLTSSSGQGPRLPGPVNRVSPR
jgi:hypothetical protein